MHPLAPITSRSARQRRAAPMRLRQTGVTLIELLVGLALGLLVMGVAIGAIIVSRSASGSVSDSTQLQQQASYAFRVLGQQIRQAGSLKLELYTETPPGTTAPLSASAKVGFEYGDYDWTKIVQGNDAPSATEYALTVGYLNYFEPKVAGSSDTSTLFRDCLGQGGSPQSGGSYLPFIMNNFALRNGELVCLGGTPGVTAQAIIGNVNDFQVRYHVQSTAANGAPSIQRTNAAGVGNWANVVAIEICLDMVGEATVAVPATSTYRNCQDNYVGYGNRVHQVFRNVFQLRSHGTLS